MAGPMELRSLDDFTSDELAEQLLDRWGPRKWNIFQLETNVATDEPSLLVDVATGMRPKFVAPARPPNQPRVAEALGLLENPFRIAGPPDEVEGPAVGNEMEEVDHGVPGLEDGFDDPGEEMVGDFDFDLAINDDVDLFDGDRESDAPADDQVLDIYHMDGPEDDDGDGGVEIQDPEEHLHLLIEATIIHGGGRVECFIEPWATHTKKARRQQFPIGAPLDKQRVVMRCGMHTGCSTTPILRSAVSDEQLLRWLFSGRTISDMGSDKAAAEAHMLIWEGMQQP